MKKIYLLLIFAAVIFAACNSRNPHNQTVGELYSSNSFLANDEKLPQTVDLSLDISKLNYQELRILRYYPYATKGIWIKEGDINSFFCSRTDWYYDLCDSLFWGNEDTNWEPLIDFDNYDSEYENYLNQAKLSDEEKAFVAKIDGRMKELSKNREITNSKGVKLQNPAMAVNLHQISNPSEKLLTLLTQNNMAIEQTDYEQLFQVYESNDYACIPSFITTDLYLQAYHMYFEYVL